MLIFAVWFTFLTLILSVGLILIQGILIPITVGVSVLLFPLPLILLLIDFFVLRYITRHPDFDNLSDSLKSKTKTSLEIMRVVKIVVKVTAIISVVCIGIGMIAGLILLYFKKHA